MTRVIPCFLHVPLNSKPWDDLTQATKAISNAINGAHLTFDEDKVDRRMEEPDTLCFSSTEFDSLEECEE